MGLGGKHVDGELEFDCTLGDFGRQVSLAAGGAVIFLNLPGTDGPVSPLAE